jgi:hypothetical protein
MAVADDILIEVYRICRDPGRTGTTEAVALKMLSHAQRAVNLFSRSYVTSYTLATVGGQAIYNTPANLGRVDLVRDGTKDIPRLTMPQLWSRDKDWPSASGSGFVAWARLGRGLVAIIPTKVAGSTVTLIGPANLADLTTINDTLLVRDDQMENLVELTEAMFTLRLRLFPAFQAVMQRLSEKYSIAPTKIFAPGIQPTDSSERTGGVAPGDIPDMEEVANNIAVQRPGAQADVAGGGPRASAARRV